MAKKLVVPIVADAALFKRGLKESETAATKFEAKVKGTATKTRSHILGIGAAFVGVGGLVEGFGAAISAAEDLEKSSSALGAQLQANGESLKAIQPQLAGLESNMAKLGFTNSETEQAFTRLDRASGSAAESFKYTALTADLARAKHIDLSAAALVVGKVMDGNVGVLNRYGIAVPKGTSATDALRIAQQKLAGQAEANATPMERFHAVLTNIEATIGQKLLPTINKYLTIVSDWLGKADNQRKITDAVSAALKGLGAILDALKATFDRIWPVLQKVHDMFGSWKPLIVAAGVALVALGVLAPWTALALGAVYVITHWKQVKSWFETFWVTLKSGFKIAWDAIQVDAYKAALAVVEPFSHLPGALGGWARKAKTSLLAGISGLSRDMQNQIDGITAAWGSGGHAAGKAWSDAAAAAMSLKNGTGITLGPGGAPMSAIPGAAGTSSATKMSAAQIGAMAKQAGLDPRAVVGVASNEGLSGGIGDNGTSFGPFQLHVGGAFPSSMSGLSTSQKQAWAWSKAGIAYALNAMVKAGAGGKTGKAAVDAIVGGFERPANPAGDLSAGYRGVGYSGGVAGASHTALPGDLTAAAKAQDAAAKAQTAAAKKAAAAAKAAATAAYKSWKENYFTPLDNEYKSDLLVTDESKRLNKLQALHAKLAIDLKTATGKEHQDILNEEDKVQGKIVSLRQKMAAEQKAILAKQHAAYVKSLQDDLAAAQTGLARQQTLFDRAWSRITAKIVGAFNATTQAGLAAIQGKYGAATPEEQARDAFQAQLNAAQRAADLAAAGDDLIAAQLAGDPEAIRQAQAKLGDVQNQQKLADLQDAADKSRAIANAASDKEQSDYQAARDEQLSNLNDWLDDQKSALERGSTTWSDFWQGAFSDAPEKYAPDAVSSLQGIIDQQNEIVRLQGLIDGGGTGGGSGGGGGGGSVSLPGGIKVPAGLLGKGFGGGFAKGGVVPGALGQPMLILAHGGETVIPNGGNAGGSTFVFNFPNYLGDTREVIDVVQREFLRLQSRGSKLGFAT